MEGSVRKITGYFLFIHCKRLRCNMTGSFREIAELVGFLYEQLTERERAEWEEMAEILHHSGIEERPSEFQHSLISHSLGHAAHQSVVVDPVVEFGQIHIYDHGQTLAHILLRTSYCLMC